MLGEKIKMLRMENNLTQKELADRLYVMAQAVSRWEKDEVEPSLTTLSEIAKVFNVTVASLLGEETAKVEKVEKKPVKEVNVYRPVLAVCRQCNKPIYNGNDIVRIPDYDNGEKIYCKACDLKNKKREKDQAISNGIACRKRSFIWGGIITAIVALIVYAVTSSSQELPVVLGATLGSLLLFPFISCLFLGNNFVIDVFAWLASWTVNFPGLIFSLDLDGIVWFITVKLTFWLISMAISLTGWVLGIALGTALSVIVYPFALAKNIRHPEESW